jgi:hypothetical protein
MYLEEWKVKLALDAIQVDEKSWKLEKCWECVAAIV